MKPNILFISVDDLNHWAGYLGAHPQARTPNLDALARNGVGFTKAYCPAPQCSPARAAVLSGRRPSTSGHYSNSTSWIDFIPPGTCIPAHFRDAGYYAATAGKITHHDVYAQDWDEMCPCTTDSTGRVGDMLCGILRDSQLELTDESFQDWESVEYCAKMLGRRHDKPLFLACGLIKPHLPAVVPRKYHEEFPSDQILLPRVKWNDLDDVPDIALELTERELIHEKVLRSGRWKLAVSNYLASMLYFDTMLGKLLRALEAGPNSQNTLVVFWSDHGLHFGEKQRWKKHTLWEEATHVPMVWYAPWLKKKGRCERVVETLGIYPTLCELAGIPAPGNLDGQSFASLVNNPLAKWDRPAISSWGRGSHAVRYQQWRYIRYRDGSEELYDQSHDPYEWTNLAGEQRVQKMKNRLLGMLRETVLDSETEETRGLLASGSLKDSLLDSESGEGDEPEEESSKVAL